MLPVALMALTMTADPRPMQIDDLFRYARVADPQISPDGKRVAYVVTTLTDPAANQSKSNLFIVPADGSTPPVRLTTTDKKDSHPRWSPDGRQLLFESNRSGESQLWVIDLTGGEARQLTTISTGASTGIWSPDGKKIAFVSAVFPEFSDKPFAESDALNKAKLAAAEKSPVKVRASNRLFVRHWDSYVENKRQHLFVMNADGTEVRDVTPGDRDAYPTSSTFSVGDDFTFSPDSGCLIFTAVPAEGEAWNTNHDLCRVSVVHPSKNWPVMVGGPAAEGSPRFSPDGKKLAYRAQATPGYEADRWKIFVRDCRPNGEIFGEETPTCVTDQLALPDGVPDVSPDEFAWTKFNGDDAIAFTADYLGRKPVFVVPVPNPSGTVWIGGGRGSHGSLTVGRDGQRFATAFSTLNSPNDVYVGGTDIRTSAMKNVTHANEAVAKDVSRGAPESVTVPVAGGKMQMWILKPPGFDAGRKWPVAYLVHGGPQGAWNDGWSFRWNPQLWAAQGYVVALPNPRGSTGFGQQFTDEITGDWGGKCYEDLMKGVEHLEGLPYVDKDRIAAAGASFGGYMMNWFAVNTDKFQTLITHCSVYNFDSMYGTTDEIWFDEWEHGGPPWGKNRASYEKHSPHRLAANLGKYKTPMLVIHNDQDFRCPIGQGQELFTALQRQGVPSRFVNFPDEGHWVLKPANSKVWHEECFDWLKRYCPPGGR